VLLRHATPRRNLPSIRRAGLLCSRSRGRLPVVWLHAPSKTPWAVLHTDKRHGGRVVAIEVEVPRSWLRRNRKRLWYCPRDIPPDRLDRLRRSGRAVSGRRPRGAAADARRGVQTVQVVGRDREEAFSPRRSRPWSAERVPGMWPTVFRQPGDRLGLVRQGVKMRRASFAHLNEAAGTGSSCLRIQAAKLLPASLCCQTNSYTRWARPAVSSSVNGGRGNDTKSQSRIEASTSACVWAFLVH